MTLSPEFVASYATQQPPWGFGGLGEIVYLRTYARDTDFGRKELWHETVARCVNGALEIGANLTDTEAEKLYDHVFHLRGSFSGRALWQLGTPLVQSHNAASLNNCYFTNIEKIEVERESEAMKARLYYLRRRTGKAAVAIKEKDRAAEIHAAKVAATTPAKA